jgi:hypothetical protein
MPNVKKKRTFFFGAALVALLLLLFICSLPVAPPELAIGMIDYPRVRSGNTPSIIIAITNLSRLSMQCDAHINIEEGSTNRIVRGYDLTLAPGAGGHIEVLRPEARGRWRVIVGGCPSWKYHLVNELSRRLHLQFLYTTYRTVYSDWIDD